VNHSDRVPYRITAAHGRRHERILGCGSLPANSPIAGYGAADQAGLTGWLSAALEKAGKSPVLDRGVVLVSVAAAIALGAASMSDIAVLAHLAPVLGTAPSGLTVRRSAASTGLPG
jgi:hypothetical protein